MRIVQPVDLALVSTNAVDDVTTQWDETVIYGQGALVVEDHVIYASSIEGNEGYRPSQEIQALTGARWVRVGMVNSRRFLDGQRSSRTEGDSPLVVEVEAQNSFNTLGLFSVSGSDVTVQLLTDAGAVLDEWSLLSGPEPVDNHWDLRNLEFHPVARRRVITNVAGYAGARVRVEITGATPQLGLLVAGRAIDVGKTLLGRETTFKRKTFTKIVTNDFGEDEVTKRATAHDVGYQVLISQEKVAVLDRIMDQIDGVRVMTYAREDRPELMNFGFVSMEETPVTLPDNYFIRIVNSGVI